MDYLACQRYLYLSYLFFSIQWILLCQFDIINSAYEYYMPCTLMTTPVKEGKLENSINLPNALDDD
jgi:hypothetical protein